MWIAVYYFSFFGALGIFLPYFSLWLVAHGLSPSQATRVLSLLPLMSLFAPPLAGLAADARRLRGWLLRLLSLATALAFLGFFIAHARVEIYVATALFALFRAPLTSLIDATTLAHVRHHGGSYGRIRLWGSLGFLVAAAGAGALVEHDGIGAIVRVAAWALALGAAVAFALPAPPPVERKGVVGAWLELLGHADWWLFLVAVGFGQMATAAYDSGFSLHLVRLGYGGRFIGAAWATGVAAEIALLAGSGAILGRVSVPRLFTLSLATAAVRWTLLACVTSPIAILCLQPLHGITFGLFWVTGVTLARDRGHAAPTAAQGLFSAAIGCGSLVGMNLAGRLLELGGGQLLYGVAGACAALATLGGWLYVARSRT
ncbi:MAG TPA: MFS transporter [Polyangia bacterium]|nr:MFS transporter [Polyangia bacterium]